MKRGANDNPRFPQWTVPVPFTRSIISLNRDIRNIVVVRLGGWADTVLASFIGPAIRERYPKAKVTLATGRSLADWAGTLYFDDVILINDKLFYSSRRLQRAGEFATAVAKLRSKQFDVALCLHPDWHHGWVCKLAGVQTTVGFTLAGQEQDFLGTVKNAFDYVVPLRPNVSEIERYLDLLRIIDVYPDKLNFKLKVRQGVHDEIMLKLAKLGLRSKGYLALGPGGGENVQRQFLNLRWPFFSEFIRLFCKKAGLPILLLGGNSDVDLVPPLLYADPQRVHSLVGRTTREEALALIAESYAYVGVDAGLGHVAGSVGVPSVILFGPTHSQVRRPPGTDVTLKTINAQVPCSPCHRDDGQFNWACTDNVCMKSISPQQVWSALSKVAGFPP